MPMDVEEIRTQIPCMPRATANELKQDRTPCVRPAPPQRAEDPETRGKRRVEQDGRHPAGSRERELLLSSAGIRAAAAEQLTGGLSALYLYLHYVY